MEGNNPYVTAFDPTPKGMCRFLLSGFNRIPATGGEICRPLRTYFTLKKRHSRPNCSDTSHPAYG